ncbi:DUF3168 domain-containing protein [Tropicimonas sp. IMCC34043]|uniref:DUF3168 domain-containing protein n=1 Tax=Tropicimonas sp. IMCC34043 TaxID=2248760 RepID=UPI000E269AE1|nr:DUF3168 domain-containing protein [Tropicimonas sp. IMCC34043]
MSYGAAAALQAAVYSRLMADPGLTGLVNGAIFDVPPAGAVPETYVSIGPEEVYEADDGTGVGARHRFTVSVVTAEAGFHEAKLVAAAVSDALHGARPALSRGRVVWITFQRAVARRFGAGNRRRIDLRFEARVDLD